VHCTTSLALFAFDQCFAVLCSSTFTVKTNHWHSVHNWFVYSNIQLLQRYFRLQICILMLLLFRCPFLIKQCVLVFLCLLGLGSLYCFNGLASILFISGTLLLVRKDRKRPIDEREF
jgi:hypothetical protein